MAEDTLGVNDEEATKGDTFLLNENAVVARDLLVPVGNQRELEVRAQTALLAGLVGPGEVRVCGIGGNTWKVREESIATNSGRILTENNSVRLGKGIKRVVKGQDFSRANKGEVPVLIQ